jgi:hypothetical protein
MAWCLVKHRDNFTITFISFISLSTSYSVLCILCHTLFSVMVSAVVPFFFYGMKHCWQQLQTVEVDFDDTFP